MKYLFCFGTRPEVIKMAPVILEMRRRGLNFSVCVTAQHREMMDQMLEVFSLVPDYDLDLMKPGQSLNGLSSVIFSKIDRVFDTADPQVVLVQGDTTTATIIAQAAFHRKIKVAHVEAGLRTHQRYSPFPEEINRQLISRLADYHFTPTVVATNNLLSEGINTNLICEAGNTVIDALAFIGKGIPDSQFPAEFGFTGDNFKKIILVTGHRRENVGQGILELCKALVDLARDKDILIIFPVHLNPDIKNTVEQQLQGYKNIKLLSPVKYDQMIALLKHCDLVITDSGGIQEEAPTFKKPVLVTREWTERQEAVTAGFSILTGANSKRIVENALKLLHEAPSFDNIPNPFGDGKAAIRIVEFLENQPS